MLPIFFIIMLLLSFFAGIIWLQIFLSKKENKWLGLILPLISICFSIIIEVVGLATFTNMTAVGQTFTQSGEIVENIIKNVPQEPLASIVSTIITGIFVFILYNIPTAILLVIYAACRGKRKKNMELEKMNIQDLS